MILFGRQVRLPQQLRVGLVARPCTSDTARAPAAGPGSPTGAGDHERLHAQVEQPARIAVDRVVGVQRGEHHVAGLGRLAGDLGRLLVADLADVDHVGVLPQDAAQLRGERLAGLGVDLDLRDVVDVVLDRVLHGDDVLLVAVDLAQAGVQRRALAGPGRAAHDEHAVRLGTTWSICVAQLVAHAELRQVADLLRAVEDDA